MVKLRTDKESVVIKTSHRVACHFVVKVGLGYGDTKERRQVYIPEELVHVMDDDGRPALIGEEGAIDDEVPRLAFPTFENDGQHLSPKYQISRGRS